MVIFFLLKPVIKWHGNARHPNPAPLLRASHKLVLRIPRAHLPVGLKRVEKKEKVRARAVILENARAKAQRMQCIYWFLTYMDYDTETMEKIEQIEKGFGGGGRWYVFQEEVEENENPNLKCTLCLKVKQRLTHLKTIESIKNGLVFSGKYEGAQLIFNRPHVICFSNSLPDTTMMSADRWKIVNIRELVEFVTQ